MSEDLAVHHVPDPTVPEPGYAVTLPASWLRVRTGVLPFGFAAVHPEPAPGGFRSNLAIQRRSVLTPPSPRQLGVLIASGAPGVSLLLATRDRPGGGAEAHAVLQPPDRPPIFRQVRTVVLADPGGHEEEVLSVALLVGACCATRLEVDGPVIAAAVTSFCWTDLSNLAGPPRPGSALPSPA